MHKPLPNPRTPSTEVDAVFTDRWSPRSFDPKPLDREDIASLFEAARWAPSCYNEQPWHFVYAVTPEDRARFAEALVEKNRQWARRAPLLLFVLSRRHFARNGKENRHFLFDAGAAWMALALQARRRGFYAHGMAGFDRDKAFEVTRSAKADYEIIAAVAVGRRGDPADLPADLAEAEAPNGRKTPQEVASEGRL